MWQHAFKLAWKRKRASLLLILEFTAVFLVLAAASMLGIRYAAYANDPLGYEVGPLWRLNVDSGRPGADGFAASDAALFARALDVVRSQPYVEAAAGIEFSPYDYASSSGAFDRAGRAFEFGRNTATDDLARTMGIPLTHGRWFSRADDGASYVPAVINAQFAQTYFRTANPVGREIEDFSRDFGRPVRVVGVIEAFRQTGEFSAPQAYAFTRSVVGDTTQRPPHALFVRVRPGTPEVRLGDLVAAVERTVGQADVDGQTFPVLRTSFLRLALLPLFTAALVAVFLLLMATLGLTGILWQNLTRRTAELGLRRALGAARHDLLRQVTLEVLALATFGAVLGLVVAGHLPLLGLFDVVPPAQFAGGLALGLALLYAAVALCTLYPARLATRLDPAEALRTE